MKKILSALVCVILSISVQAQLQNPFPQNQQEKVQTLVQKVDSLEHELSYLKLTYELYTLNSDITVFANEVFTKSIAIQLDLYTRNYSSKLRNSYQQYYESCLRRKKAIGGLIEVKKEFFTLKVITYPYTKNELNTLMASYNVINEAYNSLEHSMNVLKITIDAYK